VRRPEGREESSSGARRRRRSDLQECRRGEESSEEAREQVDEALRLHGARLPRATRHGRLHDGRSSWSGRRKSPGIHRQTGGRRQAMVDFPFFLFFMN
jgi:hypothetical protein